MLRVRMALLVEEDDELRSRMSSWLRQAGFAVTASAGPRDPSFACVAEAKACALAGPVDVVVLDLRLAEDAVMEGAPGWVLLDHYTALGKPVVVIADEADPVLVPDGAALVRRPVDAGRLVAAVRLAAAGVRPPVAVER